MTRSLNNLFVKNIQLPCFIRSFFDLETFASWPAHIWRKTYWKLSNSHVIFIHRGHFWLSFRYPYENRIEFLVKSTLPMGSSVFRIVSDFFFQVIEIVEQNYGENHSFLMWFVHHSLSVTHSVEVIKIIEQNSSESHSFLMWFVHHSVSVAHSTEMIKIVEQNSGENHSFLMWFVHHSVSVAHSTEMIKIVEQNCP
jgi:hypothetical protein